MLSVIIVGQALVNIKADSSSPLLSTCVGLKVLLKSRGLSGGWEPDEEIAL